MDRNCFSSAVLGFVAKWVNARVGCLDTELSLVCSSYSFVESIWCKALKNAFGNLDVIEITKGECASITELAIVDTSVNKFTLGDLSDTCRSSTHLTLRKVIPILFLTLFAAADGGGLPKKDRNMCALGLFFGGVGDVLIGVSHEGIVPGAIAFGIGHFFYMEKRKERVYYRRKGKTLKAAPHIGVDFETQFLRRPLKIYWPLVVVTLVWGALIGHVCVFPLLTEHPIAVTIMTLYSLILSTCLAITGSQYINRRAGDDDKGLYLRFIGFLLFYVSDSVLILTHTGYRLPFPELTILGTYYTAQYLILSGNIHSGLYVKGKRA
ncbi:hypothetical protein Y032_0034g2853 [Ancylostoma ceylanicum]|uniref:lysoplasmalogenase n=1 Tax=Ancylostoma ceylanicum TaxID=53326 RepID=A0A016ULZ1_9BILA|nr:hypothetical protein Y032_0034g2853 [Ancylostoma ceylanicum]